MRKPDDVSQEAWDAAFEAMPPAVRENDDTSPLLFVLRIGIAKAIMAAKAEEREACAQVCMVEVQSAKAMGAKQEAMGAYWCAAAIRSRKEVSP